MKHEFHVDKIYTATIVMDFPTEDPQEADEMSRDWLAEHWEEVECQLASVQHVSNSGIEHAVYAG